MLKGKKVLIGITGGIAAYKITELIRMFRRENAEVRIVTTQNALNFVTPMTLQTLSCGPLATDDWEWKNYKPGHISLADWADVMIIAPATANTIGKIANGICDNLLTSLTCAFRKTLIVAPSMNCGMWENPIVQENVEKLSKYADIAYPEDGFLACGTNGKGRLCDLQIIFDKAVKALSSKKLEGQKIVITAGGTIEKIDPVRYISNFSSGKMGTALADEAYQNGAEVVLITTKPQNKPYKVVEVNSADEMKMALDREFADTNTVIMAAAVADYRVKNEAENKIKKTDDTDSISIELAKNTDILKEISSQKGDRKIVGFCAESENLIEFAKEKIQKKGCDYLIANDISRKDIGFSSDENEVTIIDKNLNTTKLKKASKKEIAKQIFEVIYE